MSTFFIDVQLTKELSLSSSAKSRGLCGEHNYAVQVKGASVWVSEVVLV
jgi:hypothetical protein